MKNFACLIVTALLALSATYAYAQTSSCTLASLNGQCNFQGVNAPSIVGAENGHGPNAILGQMSFDGAGHVSMNRFANINGTIYKSKSSSGTYTINPDCDGDITITFPLPSGPRTFGLIFLLSQSGQTLRTINSSNTVTPTGPLFEVEAGICRFDE